MSRKFIALLCFLLSGCASPLFNVGKTETVLPLNRAWVDGQIVQYVITDVSDATVAQMMGVNYVPRLADAVEKPGNRSLLERVYKFALDEQLNVFQSGPEPAGSKNASASYSPLWRLVLVHRLKPDGSRELRSEEEILAAQERGEIRLEVTTIVINCPITRSADGQALRGVR